MCNFGIEWSGVNKSHGTQNYTKLIQKQNKKKYCKELLGWHEPNI